MASRPKGFGMTAELQAKKDGKYDPELERQVREWICEVMGSPVLSLSPDQNDFHETLKNGEILCNLVNVIQPKSVAKINSSKMAFKMMENIGNYLTACEKIGCTKNDLFQTVDLYEAGNIPQVIDGIMALGRKASKVNPNIPALGPKEATASSRNFTDEQLKAGQNVIGLQMGTNKGASQAGSTAYGLGRQINPTD